MDEIDPRPDLLPEFDDGVDEFLRYMVAEIGQMREDLDEAIERLNMLNNELQLLRQDTELAP
jgi:hypothetical protein